MKTFDYLWLCVFGICSGVLIGISNSPIISVIIPIFLNLVVGILILNQKKDSDNFQVLRISIKILGILSFLLLIGGSFGLIVKSSDFFNLADKKTSLYAELTNYDKKEIGDYLLLGIELPERDKIIRCDSTSKKNNEIQGEPKNNPEKKEINQSEKNKYETYDPDQSYFKNSVEKFELTTVELKELKETLESDKYNASDKIKELSSYKMDGIIDSIRRSNNNCTDQEIISIIKIDIEKLLN